MSNVRVDVEKTGLKYAFQTRRISVSGYASGTTSTAQLPAHRLAYALARTPRVASKISPLSAVLVLGTQFRHRALGTCAIPSRRCAQTLQFQMK